MLTDEMGPMHSGIRPEPTLLRSLANIYDAAPARHSLMVRSGPNMLLDG